VEDATVIVEGAHIVWAGPSMDLPPPHEGSSETNGLALPEVEDEIAADGFLMPGVVDRHVHIGLADPGAVVLGGVTAVRDLGWPPQEVLPLADASESPSFTGPLIRAVGPMITCAGGYPTRASWAPPGTGLEVTGADGAAAAVRANLAACGIPVVKVALNADAGPTLTDAELVAVCEAAHAQGAIVTVHAQGAGQAERALGAGVDEFAHCPWSERLADDVIQAMAKQTRVVSTLGIHGFGRDTPEVRTARENLRRFLLAGGHVAYGTDLGNGSIPPGIHRGEIEHLFRSGLSPEGILRALTFRPLEAGERADLVVLGENALETIDAYADVRMVMRTGRRVR
jgi:imidazolonepropionase-like amidohydrolase